MAKRMVLASAHHQIYYLSNCAHCVPRHLFLGLALVQWTQCRVCRHDQRHQLPKIINLQRVNQILNVLAMVLVTTTLSMICSVSIGGCTSTLHTCTSLLLAFAEISCKHFLAAQSQSDIGPLLCRENRQLLCGQPPTCWCSSLGLRG